MFDIESRPDATGNRSASGYTTPANTGNQMTTDPDGNTYTYDHNGNLATKTDSSSNVWTYTWDYRNRLTEVVEKNSGNTTIYDEQFTYDVFNNLIRDNVITAVSPLTASDRWTVFDGKNPYMDFDGSGSLTMRYLSNPQALDQFFGRVSSGGTVGWYIRDLTGSVREIVSGSGAILDQINYNPFGNIDYEYNSSNGDRFKFDSMEWVAYLGFYHSGDRWDDPVNGRWISQDPTGFASGDANLYRFVGNGPASSTDPTGDGTGAAVSAIGVCAEFMVGQHASRPAGNESGLKAGWNAFWGSIGDSFSSLPTGLAGTYLSITGHPEATRVLNQAYAQGPFGQTRNDPIAHGLVWGSLGIATVATAIASGIIVYETATAIIGRLGSLNCFPADTLISTEKGLIPIQNIRTSDLVWSFDLVGGKWKLCHVLETYQHVHEGEMVAITTAGETIEATSRHPFWVFEGQDLKNRPQAEHVPDAPANAKLPGRWVDSGDLRIGDELLLKSGKTVPITGLTTRPVKEKVYNFQVEELHCYAVGMSQVLVHNNSGLIWKEINAAVDQQAALEVRIVAAQGRAAQLGQAAGPGIAAQMEEEIALINGLLEEQNVLTHVITLLKSVIGL